MSNKAWNSIFSFHNINQHDFEKAPFILTAENVKEATTQFTKTNEREVRILCKQDTREHRPQIFKDKNLFILPIKNGTYAIVEGEGYIDIPPIESEVEVYKYGLDFKLETSLIGDSEMQHLDYAYASSLVRTFLDDKSLVLTIRGRKYSPKDGFTFVAGKYKHNLEAKSVQTEVDAGYEGRNQVVLIEAKNGKTINTIIRQLYFPFRQWQSLTSKKVSTLFFEKQNNYYSFWQFGFKDGNDYNSIYLIKSRKFKIIENG
jgi:hypothetical protein